jgi:hypothetical protein
MQSQIPLRNRSCLSHLIGHHNHKYVNEIRGWIYIYIYIYMSSLI